MDLEEAVRLVLEEAKRSGNNAVARRLVVANGTVSKWRSGKSRPEGEVRGRVFALAEEIARRTAGMKSTYLDTAAGASADRVAEFHGRSYELGIIAGHAAAVRRFLASAIEEQDRVLAGLARLGGASPRVDLSGLEEAEEEEDAKDEARQLSAAPIRRRRSAGE